MRPGYTFILISLCFLPHVLKCQDTTVADNNVIRKLGEDVLVIGEDAGDFFTAPLHFSVTDWFYAAGIAGGTVLLMTADNAAKKNIGRETILSLNKDFWDIPTTYGVVAYANIFSLGLYSAGLISGSDELRATGRMLFESLLISGVSVIALRFIFGRIRPYYNEGPWGFYWWETSNEIQSFPSGHTVVAFAMSTVLANRIDNIWASVALYGMASLTAFSRVYNNQHWLSDVAAGALLGFGAGLFVINKEEARLNPGTSSGPDVSFYPSINGLNVVLRF